MIPNDTCKTHKPPVRLVICQVSLWTFLFPFGHWVLSSGNSSWSCQRLEQGESYQGGSAWRSRDGYPGREIPYGTGQDLTRLISSKWCFSKGNPRLLQGNLGLWILYIIWPDGSWWWTFGLSIFGNRETGTCQADNDENAMFPTESNPSFGGAMWGFQTSYPLILRAELCNFYLLENQRRDRKFVL